MKCQIPSIPDDKLDLAVSTTIGAETRVHFSYENILVVGEIEFDAADQATLIKDNTFRAPTTLADGRDLQLVCAGPVLSAAAVIVVLNVVLAGGDNGTAIAKLSPPSTAQNQTFNFPPGLGVDFGVLDSTTTAVDSLATGGVVNTAAAHGLTTGDIVEIAGVTGSTPDINGVHVVTVISATSFSVDVNTTVAGTGGTIAEVDPDAQIRTVTSIASVSGGSAGAKFSIIAVPERDTFSLVACSKDKTIDIPVNKSIPIACGFNGARWVKKGRNEPPNLEIKANYSGYGDGLPRANGHRVTVLMETRKDDAILTERMFLSGWRPVVNLTNGDGDSEAEASASGIYEIFAAFV